jgi:hypothetical protein
VNVTNINASNITSGELSANRISGGTLIVGGQNNANGTIIVKDANGNQIGSISNIGVSINAYNDNRIAMQMGRYQNGGAYLFGYRSNGSTTVEIDSQYGTLNLKDSNAIRRVEMSGNTGFFALRDKNGANLITVHSDPDQADFGAQFDGPVTMNSVLDVTPRRCFAVLSSAGWYRVMKIDGGTGVWSFSVDFDITRVYSGSSNEVHSVKMLKTYNTNPSFVNEASKTNILNVSKIRYTIDSNGVGYVDIRYDSNASNTVTVDFTVHTAPAQQQYFTAESLQSVAYSPSGETVLTEYTFAVNTLGPSIGQYSEAITSFSSSSALGGYYHAFINMESTLNIKPKNVLAVFTDYSTGANPVTGFTVNGDVNLLVSFVNNTPCTVYITYLK